MERAPEAMGRQCMDCAANGNDGWGLKGTKDTLAVVAQ